MLRILPDPVKHIIQPFRFLPGQIAHPGQQEILRFLLIHEPQLVRKEFRGCEILDHMPASHVVSGTIRLQSIIKSIDKCFAVFL